MLSLVGFALALENVRGLMAKFESKVTSQLELDCNEEYIDSWVLEEDMTLKIDGSTCDSEEEDASP